ncbi:MAG: DUF192 domain-containing protein [Deltaproteobacteria bacterium]|nr:DUF192 domain-containing protein [Deltaproteobacteria bacterium]
MSRIAWKAKNLTRDALLGDRILPARNFRSRMKGLLGTDALPEGEGLWITPCNSIHSFGMRYEIDAIFIDRDDRVLGIYCYFGKNRITRPYRKARGVLELPPGTVYKTDTQIGDIVSLTPWQWRV